MMARENVLRTPVGIPFHHSLPVLSLQLNTLLQAGVFPRNENKLLTVDSQYTLIESEMT